MNPRTLHNKLKLQLQLQLKLQLSLSLRFRLRLRLRLRLISIHNNSNSSSNSLLQIYSSILPKTGIPPRTSSATVTLGLIHIPLNLHKAQPGLHFIHTSNTSNITSL